MDFVIHCSSPTLANAESNIKVHAERGSSHHPEVIAELVHYSSNRTRGEVI
ncbi:MAG: hypothetical protein ABIS50_05970 [Luteolibacter sp.]|uniref:hypothetical protein n=1 Tax=Luteolibacter sp. TaxID=1962973 RepID=UPI0032630EF4